ncbi:outer membrane porin, OprD family [Endozoicomonas sp. SM1973]|uniref:Outer membrane porin, OprD family n=1 Tax=Spartinivicinus marinus TaxID=2994442 RepID=A0A853ID83_9GAMM|nr:OprD family outer membrane porin [Spartinivicinus marinus]MCX4028724.1 OprD family outer membrane porin [Spartinivicinus marinus]NYZ68014.1 outer membrane porin, OprD family [Spartinivicinus marinus]
MKTFKFSTLAAAVVAASAASISAAQAEGFIEDSTGKLSIRNYYFNENGKNGDLKDRREWVQGFRFDFVSGYLFDTIGFDYSAGAAFKLDNPADNTKYNEKYSATNLPVDSEGNDVNNIAGTTQAYVKAKFGGENLNVNGKYGLMQQGTETFGTSGSRVLPSSIFGTYAEGNVYGVKLYGARFTETSPRHQSYFSKDLENGSGEEIDQLDIIGAGYELNNGLGFVVEHGKSDDYIKKRFAKVYYTVDLGNDMSLDLDARYGKAEENGDKFDKFSGANAYKNDDYESRYYNATATLNVGGASFGVGYNQTKDGDWHSGYFDQDHGTFNSSLSLYSNDFANEGEKAWVVNASYDFANAGVPGLTAGVSYGYGDGIERANDSDDKEREFAQEVTYKFQDGPLKDLSVQWQHWNYSGHQTDEDSHRIKLIYDIALF